MSFIFLVIYIALDITLIHLAHTLLNYVYTQDSIDIVTAYMSYSLSFILKLICLQNRKEYIVPLIYSNIASKQSQTLGRKNTL